jgi:Phage major capsid protein E
MDIFSTGVLAGVVNQIVPEYGFLTRTFFPGYQQEVAEEIHFDVRKKTRRIAPFVSPYVQGQIVEKQGFTTKTLKPAYIKDKRVFEPNSSFTRTFGERIGGSLSPMQRLEMNVATETLDQIDMLNRRIEVMCGEVLTRGKLTIEGELYPKVELDFLRDSSLTISLSGAAEWGDTGVSPLDDLDTWAELVFAVAGVRPRKVVMTLDAYKLFKNSAAVVKIFDRLRANNTLTDIPPEGDDGWYAGNISNWDVNVYGGSYIDPLDNTAKNILPPYTVILGGQSMMGYRAYGAIRDEKAGLQAMEYFSKSWVTDDPAVRYLMLQSAPIVCPLYPDAMLAATVKQ